MASILESVQQFFATAQPQDLAVLALVAVFAISFITLAAISVYKLQRRRRTGTGNLKIPGLPETEDEPPREGEEDLPSSDQSALPDSRAPPAAQPERTLEQGLARTQQGFVARLNRLFTRNSLDESLIEELEEVLFTADLGVQAADRLLRNVQDRLSRKEQADPTAVYQALRADIAQILSRPVPPYPADIKPMVIMVVGVNGVGKTTTIGKLAAQFGREGKRVVLAAGDTFRAAATEQLEVWAQRSNATLVKGAEGADPSSVIFDAIRRTQAVGADVCIADTAGRLHTKVNLMEELKKVRRVMDKALPGSPHEVMLVLDATTGQNAIQQAKEFRQAVQIDSIALTKLDGTAKGGVIIGICDELQIPVRFIGIGEQIDDLRPFEPDSFARALFA